MNEFARIDVGATEAADRNPGEIADCVAVPVCALNWLDHLDLIKDPRQISAEWQEFERHAAGTLFQSYHWVTTWLDHAAGHFGEEALIALGRDKSGQLLFILPMAIKRIFGAPALTWLGGDHSSLNFGLMDQRFGEHLTVDGAEILLKRIAAAAGNLTAVCLFNQPQTWQGRANPFAAIAPDRAVNDYYEKPLIGDFEQDYAATFSKKTRQSIRRKEKKLAALGDYQIIRPDCPEQREFVLEAFLAQKSQQLADTGASNIFATPAVSAFYRALLNCSSDGGLQFDLNAITINGDVAATLCGVRFQERFSLLLNSITSDEARCWSPGQILTRDSIEQSCANGLSYYDFGIGHAAYKCDWKAVPKPTTNLLSALTVPARFSIGLKRAILHLKRAIKSNQSVWDFYQKARKLIRASLARS